MHIYIYGYIYYILGDILQRSADVDGSRVYSAKWSLSKGDETIQNGLPHILKIKKDSKKIINAHRPQKLKSGFH